MRRARFEPHQRHARDDRRRLVRLGTPVTAYVTWDGRLHGLPQLVPRQHVDQSPATSGRPASIRASQPDARLAAVRACPPSTVTILVLNFSRGETGLPARAASGCHGVDPDPGKSECWWGSGLRLTTPIRDAVCATCQPTIRRPCGAHPAPLLRRGGVNVHRSCNDDGSENWTSDGLASTTTATWPTTEPTPTVAVCRRLRNRRHGAVSSANPPARIAIRPEAALRGSTVLRRAAGPARARAQGATKDQAAVSPLSKPSRKTGPRPRARRAPRCRARGSSSRARSRRARCGTSSAAILRVRETPPLRSRRRAAPGRCRRWCRRTRQSVGSVPEGVEDDVPQEPVGGDRERVRAERDAGQRGEVLVGPALGVEPGRCPGRSSQQPDRPGAAATVVRGRLCGSSSGTRCSRVRSGSCRRCGSPRRRCSPRSSRAVRVALEVSGPPAPLSAP